MNDNDMFFENVPLSHLRLDGGTQSRAAMDEAIIAEYTDALCDGATLPPLVVYFDGVEFWLADGFHRYHAYRAASVDLVAAEVRTGTRRDAVLYSVGANATHGLRRTNADKRRAVETLLADAEWAAWSDREIARVCSVSNNFVSEQRKAICHPMTDAPVAPILGDSQDSQATRTVTRGGKTYQQNTANIGKVQEPVERPAPYPDAIAPAMAAVDRPLPLADTPKDTPTEAADAVELAALRAENAELREELDDLKASFADTLADNESMGKVIDADDQLKTVMAEVKRLQAVADSAERVLRSKLGEFAEAIRSAKSWKKRAEKAERALGKAA